MQAVITNPTGFEITVQGALYPVAYIKAGTQTVPVKNREHFDWLKGQLERLLKHAPHLLIELVEEAEPEPEQAKPEQAKPEQPEPEQPEPEQAKPKGKTKQSR
jgi:hypothetical protein